LKLDKYVAGGELDQQKAIGLMMDACASNGSLQGDGNAACLATIMNGLEKGKTEPKKILERKISSFLIAEGQKGANEASPADQLPIIQVKNGELVSKGINTSRPDGMSELEPTYPEFHAALMAMAFKSANKRGQQPDAAMFGNYLQVQG
jgi:hypothetical protein